MCWWCRVLFVCRVFQKLIGEGGREYGVLFVEKGGDWKQLMVDWWSVVWLLAGSAKVVVCRIVACNWLYLWFSCCSSSVKVQVEIGFMGRLGLVSFYFVLLPLR